MELKMVRHALIKCLKYARILFLEREYLNFLRPNLKVRPSERITPELLLDLPSDSPLNNDDLINSSMMNFSTSMDKDTNILA